MGRYLREDDVQGPATEKGGKTFDDLKGFKVEDTGSQALRELLTDAASAVPGLRSACAGDFKGCFCSAWAAQRMRWRLQGLFLQCLGCTGHALGIARVVKSLPAPNWKGI